MNTDADYPRVLIVNAHFSEQSGSGIYLGKLFSAWPVDRLATVGGGSTAPDWKMCRKHYQTGHLEHRLPAPLKWLVPPVASGPQVPPALSDSCSIAPPQSVTLARRLARYPWRMLLKLMDGGEILYRVGPSPELLDWIREFQPEVIYGHCSDLNSGIFLRHIQQALGLPLVLHCMDDWPATLYNESAPILQLRQRYLNEFANILRSTDVVIAICQEMAEEYAGRYQRQVLWLPMPVDLRDYQAATRNQWTAGRPFRLRYGGRIGWAIRESLLDMAQAVSSLRLENLELTFEIVTFQGADVPLACLVADGVSVQVPGPLADVPRSNTSADLLVICYDYDTSAFEQARYSMPSKMADCMASGTPILIYGPAGLPVVEYARREGWGKVVDQRDPVALQAAVRELMDSAALREQLGRAAQRLATERHDSKVVSEKMRVLLRDVGTRSI